MRPLPIDEKGGVLLVKVGEGAVLNENQAAGLRQGLYEAIASRPTPRVAVDLSNVDYLSSTGIALLIGTKRRVDAAQGQLVLFGLHPEIVDLFDSMRLTTLFDITPDEVTALALFPPPVAS
jgi:anti-sigma B factor antagonist